MSSGLQMLALLVIIVHSMMALVVPTWWCAIIMCTKVMSTELHAGTAIMLASVCCMMESMAAAGDMAAC